MQPPSRPIARPAILPLSGVLHSASLVLAATAASCRIADPTGASPNPPVASAEAPAIRAMLDSLYEDFCFDAGGQADWESMEAHFAPDAVFFSPAAPGAPPRGLDGAGFLAEFRAYVNDSGVARTGLHERIVNVDIHVFGGIAHALVVFDAFAPGELPEQPPARRGLDSIQLLRGGDRWLLASFTTQYEREDLQLPAR